MVETILVELQQIKKKNTGIIPHCRPNEFFCLMLRLVKGCRIEEDIKLLKDFIELKTEENNAYSQIFIKIY